MKKAFFIMLLFQAVLCHAQSVDSLHAEGKALMMRGDFEQATTYLGNAYKNNPNNLEVAKDYAYASVLKRDYANAIQIGKVITERPDADVQSFQILGLAYKSIAAYNDAEKLYEKGITKYPESGVLYSEYGETLSSENKNADAIKQWEKGIEADVNFGSNYYFAAKYYAQKNQPLKTWLYGETFANIESFTQRTDEIKSILVAAEPQLLNTATLNNTIKNGSDFEKTIAATLLSVLGTNADSSLQAVVNVKKKFTEQWFQKPAATYPYRLFEHYRFLVARNMFDAYNQWLLNSNNYNTWAAAHSDEASEFKRYKQNVIYKIPKGQFYK